MRRLRDDGALRNALSDGAWIRAEHFSPQAAASSLMALYGRVLNSSGTPVAAVTDGRPGCDARSGAVHLAAGRDRGEPR